ncbi:MAG: hypothetical protein AAF657_33100, partial [Acidobacteriota bacterium]
VMTAVEPFEGTDFDNLSPQDEQDLVDAVDDLVQGLDLPDPSSQMSDMLQELAEAMLEHGLQAMAGAVGLACPDPLIETLIHLAKALVLEVQLLVDIINSDKTCQNTEPNIVLNILLKIICFEEVMFWSQGFEGTRIALEQLTLMVPHFVAFMDGVRADGIGDALIAQQQNSAQIAREAKHVAQHIAGVTHGFEEAAPPIGAIMMLTELIDRDVYDKAKSTYEELGAGAGAWYVGRNCTRRVISPRLQASVVRNRLYVYTENGLVSVPVQGTETLTALPRHLATGQVIEIEAGALFAQNPQLIPEFDEANQMQTLTVLACEGVVIGADPDPLIALGFPEEPWQVAGTDYWIGDLSTGPGCVSKWWMGITPGRTEMVRPLAAPSLHRACESIDFIDNNNDGVAEGSVGAECFLVEPDPAGEVEEDIATVPIDSDIHGATAWSQISGDMLCNAGTLSLISPAGLEQREVRQEFVVNTASCWTRESDGAQISAYHPQDSTQIRFVLVDNDWGEPRPRGCYDFDAPTGKWQCNGSAGCDCSAGGGGPAPPPMP